MAVITLQRTCVDEKFKTKPNLCQTFVLMPVHHGWVLLGGVSRGTWWISISISWNSRYYSDLCLLQSSFGSILKEDPIDG